MKKISSIIALLLAAAPSYAQHLKAAAGMRNPGTNCTAAEQAAVDDALPQAKMRVFNVQQKFAGIAPPGPRGEDYQAVSNKLEVDRYGRTIFGDDYSKVDIDYYIRGMRDVLWSKPAISCSDASDKHCMARSGYVMGGSRVIHVCPEFFSGSAEERVRTLVHESAHVAGISENDGKESYCGKFTCDASCGSDGAKVADNWSQWVHCSSGQTPDQPEQITASAKRP
jgi:hypothetical protein